MTIRRSTILILAAILCSGCYHATVNTAMDPATPKTAEWKHSFIYGLVPMSPTSAEAVCKDRPVARVETRLPFVQGLVALLTAGIYIPWEVSVTCGPLPASKPKENSEHPTQPGEPSP